MTEGDDANMIAFSGRPNGVDIAIEGEFGTYADVLRPDEASMFTALQALRAALSPANPDQVYQFFMYHDVGSATYRSFKSCTTVRFDCDLSNKQLFTYSALIHASDPTVYTTAPS